MHYWTKDIVLDPNDPSQNSWYVCVFSGWGGAPNGLGGLYKTTNRGSSWTKLTGSQFDRVTSISFDPDNLNKAYLTTEIQGLWYSEDMNSLVPTWTDVLSYPFRQPERVFFNPYDHTKIWVTSFGTGMKSGDLQEVIGVSEHSSKNKNDLIVYPNPVNGKFNLKYNSVVSTTAIIEICNAMGQVKFEKKINSNPGENKIMISMDEFEKGIYILTLKDDVGVKCARVIIE